MALAINDCGGFLVPFWTLRALIVDGNLKVFDVRIFLKARLNLFK